MNQNGTTKVNWGREVLHVLGIVGKVLFKIFSYFMNVLLTVLLIGLITGVIVGTVFAIYINNYLDLEFDASTIVTVNQDSATRIYYMDYDYNSCQYARTGEHLIHNLYGKVGGIRMTGSAALAICYVAAGRFDAWAEAFIGKWDYSAAALLVLEAGGRVTDFYGNESFIEGHHIIATNGHLHSTLQQLIQEVPPLGM